MTRKQEFCRWALHRLHRSGVAFFVGILKLYLTSLPLSQLIFQCLQYTVRLCSSHCDSIVEVFEAFVLKDLVMVIVADDLNAVGFTVEWGWFSHAIHATIITKEKHKLWLTRCIYSNANSYGYTIHLYQVWSDPVTSGIFCSGIKEKKRRRKNRNGFCTPLDLADGFVTISWIHAIRFCRDFSPAQHKQNLIFPNFRTSCAPCWFVPMRIFFILITKHV